MPRKQPEFPITPEEVVEFERLIKVWQKRLHLDGWRIHKGRRRPVSSLAEVEFSPADKQAKIHIGRDWGAGPPDPDELEETVVHELLHVLLHDLANLAEEADEDKVHEYEHAVIVPLAKTLIKLAKEKAP